MKTGSAAKIVRAFDATTESPATAPLSTDLPRTAKTVNIATNMPASTSLFPLMAVVETESGQNAYKTDARLMTASLHIVPFRDSHIANRVSSTQIAKTIMTLGSFHKYVSRPIT